MQRQFFGVEIGQRFEVAVPLCSDPMFWEPGKGRIPSRTAWWLSIMGRLKPGVTLDQVNAEFIALARHLAEDYPKTNQNFTSATVQPLVNAFTGVQLRQIVWAMLGAVILVLLIACANLTSLLLARGRFAR